MIWYENEHQISLYLYHYQNFIGKALVSTDFLSTLDEIDNEGAGTEDTIVEEKKEKKKKKDKAGTVITATDDETPQVPKGPKLKTDPKKMTKEEKKRFELGFDIIDDSSDEAEEEEVKTPIAEIKESKGDLTFGSQ